LSAPRSPPFHCAAPSSNKQRTRPRPQTNPQLALIPIAGGVWFVARRRILRIQHLKDAAEIDSHDGVKWNKKNTVIFPLICTSAGLIAGMFGQGGSIVTTPLMLEMHVHPQVGLFVLWEDGRRRAS
jgi:hypothetical protein